MVVGLLEPLVEPEEDLNARKPSTGPTAAKRASVVQPIIGGTLAGVLTLFRAVSFASVFAHASPELAPFLGLFLQGLLVTTVLSQAVYTFGHSLPWCVACPSSTCVPFTARLIATVAKVAPTPAAAALSGLAVSALASLAMGVLFSLLRIFAGHMDMIKGCFPFPLVLGLLASVGFSMAQSGYELAVGPEALGSWATAGPQIALCVTSGVMMRSLMMTSFGRRNVVVFPIVLVLQVVLFWAMALSVTTKEAVASEGWLFDAFESYPLGEYGSFWGAVLRPSTWRAGALSHFLGAPGLLGQMLAILPVIMLDLMTGAVVPIEQLAGMELPMSRELGLAASTCLFGAASGCQPSYVSLSPSRMCLDGGGADSRLAGVLAMVVPAAAISPLGPVIVAHCPRFLVGGLLVHLGAGYVLEGLWDSRRLIAVVAPSEYAVIFAIVVFSVLIGLPQAMLLGLFIQSFLFVLHYGQGEVVLFATSIKDCPALRSCRYRSAEEVAQLDSLLARACLVRTKCSHLFFGSVPAIIAAANANMTTVDEGRGFLLLDLDSVRTIDSSALVALQRMPSHVQLILANLPTELKTELRISSVLKKIRVFGTLDQALEFCEDQLLHPAIDESTFGAIGRFALDSVMSPNAVGARPDQLTAKMTRNLAETKVPSRMSNDETASLLRSCLPGAPESLTLLLNGERYSSHMSFVCCEVVFETGSHCKGLYVCLKGALTLYSAAVTLPKVIDSALGLDPLIKQVVGKGEEGKRLRSLGPGDTFGEAAMLSGAPELVCSCSMVANVGCELLLLRREAVLSLEAGELRQALELQKAISRRLMLSPSGSQELTADRPCTSGSLPRSSFAAAGYSRP